MHCPQGKNICFMKVGFWQRPIAYLEAKADPERRAAIASKALEFLPTRTTFFPIAAH